VHIRLRFRQSLIDLGVPIHQLLRGHEQFSPFVELHFEIVTCLEP
jgi:hypothetical protein